MLAGAISGPSGHVGNHKEQLLTMVWHMFLGVFRVKETKFVVILHLASSILAVAPPGGGVIWELFDDFLQVTIPVNHTLSCFGSNYRYDSCLSKSISAKGVVRIRNGGQMAEICYRFCPCFRKRRGVI